MFEIELTCGDSFPSDSECGNFLLAFDLEDTSVVTWYCNTEDAIGNDGIELELTVTCPFCNIVAKYVNATVWL